MALKNNDSKGIKYVRIKDGKFYLNTDLDTAYDELEGLITGIRFKEDVFEGKPIRKCNFGLSDETDGSTYVISVSVDSSYFSSLVGFLKNADITKTLTLHPKISKYKKDDGSEGERRSILVSQDGTFLKNFYGKDTGNKLPEFKKVKLNGKLVYDKTDFLEALEEIVVKDFIPALPKPTLVTYTEQPKEKVSTVANETNDAVEEFGAPSANGKLPWDN